MGGLFKSDFGGVEVYPDLVLPRTAQTGKRLLEPSLDKVQGRRQDKPLPQQGASSKTLTEVSDVSDLSEGCFKNFFHLL